MQFFNLTPFESEHTILMDKDGAETLLVIVKATYTLNANEILEPAKEQKEVIMADEFVGDVGTSSIKYESDLALFKPGLDVVLVGHAWNNNSMTEYVDVLLKFNDTSKAIRVFGDRFWRKNIIGYSITKPKPFETIPLIYELAFGGTDDTASDTTMASEPYNPIGCGFRSKKSRTEINGTMLPNLEDPENLINSPKDMPSPACFGFVSRDWEPRKSYAGDYGEEWQKNRMPLLPEDFDPMYYNFASNGLVLDEYIKGGETVEIRNATKNGLLQFKIPKNELEAVVGIDYEFEIKDINFDTVIINADEDVLILIGRNSFNIQNKIHDIQFVKIQYKPEE